MRPAPATPRSEPTLSHGAPAGAGSAPRFPLSAARAVTAMELRHAGALRRDAAAGRLPRGPAISAIRDCLRHARHTRTLAALMTAGLLAACAPQSPPTLSADDGGSVLDISAPRETRDSTLDIIEHFRPARERLAPDASPRPEPRPEAL